MNVPPQCVKQIRMQVILCNQAGALCASRFNEARCALRASHAKHGEKMHREAIHFSHTYIRSSRSDSLIAFQPLTLE